MLLSLTTPLTQSDDVRRLQILLKSRGYLAGALDGAYGPETARAVYRAKYWLGYSKLNHEAGNALIAFLNGSRKKTPMMLALAKKRELAKKRIPIRTRMFREAQSHIGEKENPPGSNRIFYSTWYGLIGPWCAMFVTRCGTKAGSKAFKRGVNYAYVPYIVHDALAGRNNLAATNDPKQGDLVCYDWNKDGVADHVGLFDKWINQSEFTAIEGNTSVGNDSNGGEVMVRTRHRNDVQVFAHVGG